ncbi:MAG: tetratricopeptide repeat protein [Ignavibacteria bacterium]|nr:MAG: tetratricopeptide repeat protein [Ignavibacteria bacterium]
MQISYNGQPVQGLNSSRLHSLIAYLILQKESEIYRQRMSFLFWPESSEKQARTNLRQLLHHLKTNFPEIGNYLEISSQTMRWKSNTSINIDVEKFEQALKVAKDAKRENDFDKEKQELEKAANLFQIELVPECYDEWIEPLREEFHQKGIRMLDRLCELCELKGDYISALEYGQKLLTLDNYTEATYRRLMRLFALNQDRHSALRMYKKCARVLHEELGIEPSLETQEMFQRLGRMSQIQFKESSPTIDIPLVGRENEQSEMHKIWETVKTGHARLLMICGEAGIGKTRLLEEFTQYLERQGYITATAYCYPSEGNLPYSPLSDLLKTNNVYTMLTGLKDIWKTEIARLLPELLEEKSELSHPKPLSEDWQKLRFFKALVHTFLSVSQPLFLFIDDLHWADPDTIEWLHYLLRSRPNSQILIATTVRTGALNMNESLLSFLLELRKTELLREIELKHMNPEQTIKLAQYVSGITLSESAAEMLYSKTDGNPLFIVEMTRAALDGLKNKGIAVPEALSINPLPHKIQAVIQTRLSHISSDARRILNFAAITGRRFNFKILQEGIEKDDDKLVKLLEELLNHRLIREQEEMNFDFTHETIHEVILNQISDTRKYVLHRHVAEAFEKVYSDHSDRFSGKLAYHWENAGEWRKAILCYKLAANTAMNLFANEEATDYFRKALSLIKSHLPDSEGDKEELQVLRRFSNCLVQCRGYGNQEVQKVGSRIFQLYQEIGGMPDPPLLRMLAISKLVIGEFNQAEQFGMQLLKQAHQSKDKVAEVEAHYVLGVTYHWQGQFKKAESHLKKALALYDSENLSVHLSSYAQDPAVICRIRLAMVYWHLGHPLKSESLAGEALERAEIVEHPFTRSYALHWFSWLQNLKGNVMKTLEFARASISFSEKYYFPYFATQSDILYGWALFQEGKEEEGIQRMREGLSRFRATGTEVGCSYYRALIAEALTITGTFDQSLVLLKEAVKNGEKIGEGWSTATILRIKAKVLNQKQGANFSRTEKLFQQAIRIARQNNDKITALMAINELREITQVKDRDNKNGNLYDEIFEWAVKDMSSREKSWLKSFLQS